MMLLALAAVTVGAGVGAAATHVLSKRRRKAWGAAVTVGLPHPAWTPGAPQPSPYGDGEWTYLDPDSLEKAAMYALTISMVVPRPVAFISSVDGEGNVNLAPYSYFNAVCERRVWPAGQGAAVHAPRCAAPFPLRGARAAKRELAPRCATLCPSQVTTPARW